MLKLGKPLYIFFFSHQLNGWKIYSRYDLCFIIFFYSLCFLCEKFGFTFKDEWRRKIWGYLANYLKKKEGEREGEQKKLF